MATVLLILHDPRGESYYATWTLQYLCTYPQPVPAYLSLVWPYA